MAMSKQDYEQVAEVFVHLSTSFPVLDYTDPAKAVADYQFELARLLANIFQNSNPRFDRERFLKAAEIV